MNKPDPKIAPAVKHTLWSLLESHRVTIPLIQRGYAQGRNNKIAGRIREAFITNLYQTLTFETEPKSLELDFVYGKIAGQTVGEDGPPILELLDGQQRLTTLYLLHWYCAWREDRLAEAAARLKNFSYQVRPSSRDFCSFLCSPELSEGLKATAAGLSPPLCRRLGDQSGFIPLWTRDGTVTGMLTMLAAIEAKFAAVPATGGPSLFDRLTAASPPTIFFSFLSMDSQEFSLSDVLYITMNSRGKLLTPFELFKSNFLDLIANKHGQAKRQEMAQCLDGEWTDLFWHETKEAKERKAAAMDESFFNFIKFVMLMLAVWSREGDTARTRADETEYSRVKDLDPLELAGEVFAGESATPLAREEECGNLDFLEKILAALRERRNEHGSLTKAFEIQCPFCLYFT